MGFRFSGSLKLLFRYLAFVVNTATFDFVSRVVLIQSALDFENCLFYCEFFFFLANHFSWMELWWFLKRLLAIKLDAKFIGLYLNLIQTSLVAFHLQLPHALRVHPVFNYSILSWNNCIGLCVFLPTMLPCHSWNWEEEFEVKCILDYWCRL